MRKFIVLGSVFLVSHFLSGCPNTGPRNRAMQQTQIRGAAPLHRGGIARIIMLDDSDPQTGRRGEEIGSAAISGDGNFAVLLEDAGGNFDVVADGGQYRDPVLGHPVSMMDEPMHAAVYGVSPGQTVELAVTPWSELVFQYNRAHPGSADHEAARAALDKSLGCEDRGLTRALPATPSAESPLRASKNDDIGYVHLGAWTTLAHQLGRELGLGDHELTLAYLVRSVGQSIASSGKLDGPVQIRGRFVPSDLLRQRFAQATRHFVDTGHAEVALRSQDISQLLDCTSRGGPDMWGPAGEAIDLDEPIIDMDPPRVVGGPAQISCKARDISGIATLTIDANQGGTIYSGKPVFPYESLEGQGTPEAKLSVTFNPADLASGAVGIRCTATDRWENRRESTVTYRVNKGAVSPDLSFSASTTSDDKTYIQGRVAVTCTCKDEYLAADDACRLDDASQLVPGMGTGAWQGRSMRYMWDTTGLVDGEQTITCQARSQGFPDPIAPPRKVYIKNHDPMKVSGSVNLDTPVQGMEVAAWAWEHGTKGRQLSERVKATNGNFILEVTNEYSGPILFEASVVISEDSGLGSYTSLATGQTMYIETHQHLSLLWDAYTPTKQIPRLTINAATTIAQAYAEALFKSGPEGVRNNTTVAVKNGLDFMRLHLEPEGSLDPRTTRVGDLSKGGEGAGQENQVLLALFHVGLSRLAAEKGSAVDKLSTMDLLGGVLADLEGDALLNGLNAKGKSIGVGPEYHVSKETLRLDLAQAARHWLSNREMHKHVFEMSSLDASKYARAKRFLRWLATNGAEIFGGVAGSDFDVDAPTLTVLLKCGSDPKFYDIDDFSGRYCSGFVDMEVTAIDDSAINLVTATVLDKNLSLKPVGDPVTGLPKVVTKFSWNTESYPNDVVTLAFNAFDKYDNNEPVEVEFFVDNKAPNVTISPKWVAKKSDMWFSGTADKNVARVDIKKGTRVAGTYEPGPGADNSNAFTVHTNLPCDAEHTLTVVATDFAGNQSEPREITVRCDTVAPLILFERTPIVHDFAGGSDRSLGDGGEPPTINKYVTDMDSGAPNLPRLRFNVRDVGSDRSVGSDPTRLKVEWAYTLVSKHGGKRELGWMPISMKDSNNGTGHYEIELSYQMLLPPGTTSLDIASARAANFVARSTPEDVHVIQVRATDEFGNQAEPKEQKFFFNIHSPPIRVSCANVVPDADAPQQRARMFSFAQGGPMGDVRLDWTKQLSPTSLAPNLASGSAQVEMPNINYVYDVKRIARQVAVLRRKTAEFFERDHGCPDNRHSWARRYDDNGECGPGRNGDLRNNRWLEDYNPSMSTVPMSVVGTPTTPSVQMKMGTSTAVMYTASQPSPFHPARDTRLRDRLEFRYRTAVEWERNVHWGSPDIVWLDERYFAWTMDIKPGWPSTLSALMHGGLPPADVVVDSSCARSISYQDEHDEREDNGVR